MHDFVVITKLTALMASAVMLHATKHGRLLLFAITMRHIHCLVR